MTDRSYLEELSAQLRRPSDRSGERRHDRDIARLLAPWRRHRGWPDTMTWGE
jgi:hypothetical protein